MTDHDMIMHAYDQPEQFPTFMNAELKTLLIWVYISCMTHILIAWGYCEC